LAPFEDSFQVAGKQAKTVTEASAKLQQRTSCKRYPFICQKRSRAMHRHADRKAKVTKKSDLIKVHGWPKQVQLPQISKKKEKEDKYDHHVIRLRVCHLQAIFAEHGEQRLLGHVGT
jgi:hypothetical protein